MKRSMFGAIAAAAVALSLAAGVAVAQPAGSIQAQSPLTRDLGALRTMTTQGAGTITSADQSGFNVSRVVCVFNQSAHGGSPSSTFKIQNKDAASNAYYDLVTSSAITQDATPTALAAGGGVTVVSNVSTSLPIANKWRISATVGGSATPTVTGTIGCSVQ